ncbi:ice-binding family protein [Marinobacter sp. TBZ242]|uniref:Ice-binding family protein n=1 Tax=Marinobacter azerbaijanicus TaxID=3050455 RepID=A0ABT7IHA3_9GAMM|nr:ice-binding family protein [Marinobacter sp. TBZ242]MDL0433553.1 ice-binding family protein [Marinobacter sp. TBZ242]
MNNIKNATKYLFSAFFVLIALSLSACFSGSNNSKTTTDEPVVIAALSVTSSAPADAQTGIGTNSKVVAVFNKDVKSETVNETSFTLQGAGETSVVGVVSYDSATTTASLKPSSNLSSMTVYTATLTTDVEDEAGDSLVEEVVWTFTTGELADTSAPALDVAGTTPKDADTGVLRNVKLNIVFTEAVDPVSISAQSIALKTDDTASTVVAGELSFINPTTVVFSPDADLAGDTLYRLTLSDAITDLAGNTLAVTTLGFKTGLKASSSPLAVDLGTAGNYVLLAKTGISTTGTTDILGDIAVSPVDSTALTGFNETLDASGTFATSALITGKLFAANMSPDTPAILTTAVSNMETAYTDAAGRTLPDFTELGAGEIGGLTLDPGLYKWGTGVLVTSDVTLNGSSTDVWIFQIAEGLKLQDGKSIILAGGALPQNIFWQVAEDVTLQAGTTFNGIILGKTAVNMNTGAVFNGRALVQTAVTLIANDVNQPSE